MIKWHLAFVVKKCTFSSRQLEIHLEENKIKLYPNFSQFINQDTFQMDQRFKCKISGTIKMLEENMFFLYSLMRKTFIIMPLSHRAIKTKVVKFDILKSKVCNKKYK